MFDDLANEFQDVDEQVIEDPFAVVIHSEIEDYSPTQEDLAEMGQAFSEFDARNSEQDAEIDF